ncbi:MAG TPA: type II toxin-antitoxin system ParD family antitoxin [Caulobacteraceae bacterium]|nr:type II toxin-antitoxin system ParD family antitoxin [Caulobacteraceae bacterium]
MNVSLTPELEAFVDEAVASGRYGSASEAVRAALRLLQEREAKFQALKRDIERGLESADQALAGEDLARDVKRAGRERLQRLRAAE